MTLPVQNALTGRTCQWIRQLEAWVQREIGAKQNLLELLERQEQSFGSQDADALAQWAAAVQAALEAEPPRAGERRAILEGLAAELGLRTEALTLGGIALRAGSEGVRLQRLRGELRSLCVAVQAKGRRIALIAQAQRSVLKEMLEALLGPGPAEQDGRGSLVNREA